MAVLQLLRLTALVKFEKSPALVCLNSQQLATAFCNCNGVSDVPKMLLACNYSERSHAQT